MAPTIGGIRILLRPIPDKPHLLAYADMHYGQLIIRRIKIYQCGNGPIKVGYPDLPLKAACQACRTHTGQNFSYCHHCGAPQPHRVPGIAKSGARKRFFAVAFPAGKPERASLDRAILEAYLAETGVIPFVRPATSPTKGVAS